MIEDCRQHKANESPDTAPQSNPAPARMRSDQLSPQNGRAEGNDSEDQHSNVLAALASRRKLGRDGQRCQLVDTSANAREHHASNENVHRTSG